MNKIKFKNPKKKKMNLHHYSPKSKRFTLNVVYYMGFDKCKMTCTHNCSIIHNSFTALKILCAPPIHPSPNSPTLEPLISLL